MNKIKLVVCGARGRMGREVLSLVNEEKEKWELVGIVESPTHPEIGMEIYKGLRLTCHLEEVAQKGAVIIEFTTPRASLEHLDIACKRGVPCVIGTTGFRESEIERIRQISEKIPVLLSPNMSIGINLLFFIVRQIAEILKDFDREIVEAHHHLKQDAPSGTARRIAEILAEVEGKKLSDVAVYGRKGITSSRKKEEIGIHSVRAGSIVGDHTVIFAGDGERIEIIHRAESRRIFARGALVAAQFIVNQKPGLYDLQDALGIQK